MKFNPETDFGTEVETALRLTGDVPTLSHYRCFMCPQGLINLIDANWLSVGTSIGPMGSPADSVVKKLHLYWLREVVLDHGGINHRVVFGDYQTIAVKTHNQVAVVMVTAFETLRRSYREKGWFNMSEFVEELPINYLGDIDE